MRPPVRPFLLIAVQDKLSAEERKTILDAVSEALEWVEEHSEAEPEEFKCVLESNSNF